MLKPLQQLLARFSKAQPYNRAVVGKDQAGLRLDQYLKAHGVKWSAVHRSLRNRYYYVRDHEDKMVRDAGYRLKLDDEVFYPTNSELHQFLQSQTDESDFYKVPREQALKEIQSMMIFENEHVIVLNKKAGYATQGGQDFERNLFTLLISCYDRSSVHIMHRLDLPCSGVVMFAKSSEAARLIQPAITGRQCFHKFYLASVEGQPNPASGLIDCNIEWNNNKKRARLASPTMKGSQTAFTYYKVLTTTSSNSLCLVKLLTGRKHQIRCHFAQYLQTPIINDSLYGSAKDQGKKQEISLHSYALVIDREDITNIFERKPVESPNGNILFNQNRLWITAELPSRFQAKQPIDQNKVLKEANKLLTYSPSTPSKKKFVTY